MGVEASETEIVLRGRHNSGGIAPDSECHVADRTIFSGGYEVAVKLEVIVNPAVIGQKALCRCRVATALHEDVENCPALVYRPPQIVQLAPDADKHFVQKSLVTGVRSASSQPQSKEPAEADAPVPDGFVLTMTPRAARISSTSGRLKLKR